MSFKYKIGLLRRLNMCYTSAKWRRIEGGRIKYKVFYVGYKGDVKSRFICLQNDDV